MSLSDWRLKELKNCKDIFIIYLQKKIFKAY